MRNQLISIFVLASLVSCSSNAHHSAAADAPTRAIAKVVSIGDSGADGAVEFTATPAGVRVQGRIEGLTPGKHAFHIHEFGDVTMSDDGKCAGGHFAPRGLPHGDRSATDRHVGDLGNIIAGADGVAEFDFVDSVIALHGMASVIGRSVMVHAGEDKFTQPSGGAGARVAFGVVGIAGPAH